MNSRDTLIGHISTLTSLTESPEKLQDWANLRQKEINRFWEKVRAPKAPLSGEISETTSVSAPTGPSSELTLEIFPQGLVSLEAYQRWVDSLWVVGGNEMSPQNVAHAVLGLVGEAGETAELFKKAFRGDNEGVIDRDKLIKELGDVIYYWAKIASLYGIDTTDIIRANVHKLEGRKARGTLNGSGDNR